MTRSTARGLVIAFFCALAPAAFFAAGGSAKTAPARIRCSTCGPTRRAHSVFLDGKKIGTSAGLFPVEPGKVTIVVELDGHKENSCQVTVGANRVTRVVLILEPEAKAAEKTTEKTAAKKEPRHRPPPGRKPAAARPPPSARRRPPRRRRTPRPPCKTRSS